MPKSFPSASSIPEMFFGLLRSTRTIFLPLSILAKRGCNVRGRIDRPAASESQGAALVFRTHSSPGIFSVAAGWSSHFFKTRRSLATEPHRFGQSSTTSKCSKKSGCLKVPFNPQNLQDLVGIHVDRDMHALRKGQLIDDRPDRAAEAPNRFCPKENLVPVKAFGSFNRRRHDWVESDG
jgi:hypothetical protein